MQTKIDKKIVSQRIVKNEPEVIEQVQYDTMHEDIERGEVLLGKTYKFKTPLSEHAVYITINNIILNQGTEVEEIHPREVFINCKEMTNFQWITALTRLISAVFRKGGDIIFIVEELKAVFDPSGGFWEKGTFHPSIVAKIGQIIELHLKDIGLIESEKLTQEQLTILEDKVKDYQAKNGTGIEDDGYPRQATLCPKCSERSIIVMDGCPQCINTSCAYSKCDGK